MKKKKILIIASALSLLLIFPACGKEESSTGQTLDSKSETRSLLSKKDESSQDLFEWLGYEEFE
ncbi:hypothetical protein M5X02_31815, partial [Paenibacillus alvei]|nr:hypothetical protein [Paenibacillus alvei]